MNKIKLSLDTVQLKNPLNSCGRDMVESWIAERRESFRVKDMEKLAEQVGALGRTFCLATFKNGKKSIDDFEQMQLFALYFDNRRTTVKESITKARDYGLPVLFAYDTFSLGSRNRYTLVFLNESPVFKIKEAEAIQKALMRIFPEAHESSNDVLYMYSGGRKLLYFDKSIPQMNAYSLFMSMSFYLRMQYGTKNYRRKIIKFSEETGIALNDRKLPDITWTEKSPENINKLIEMKHENFSPKSTIYNNTINGDKFSKLSYIINFNDNTNVTNNSIAISDKENDSKVTDIIHKDNELVNYRDITSINNCDNNIKKKLDNPSGELKVTKGKKHRPFRADDIKLLNENCRLYQEFESGSRKIPRRELLGITSNLVQIETGEDKFLYALKKNKYYKNIPFEYEMWRYFFFYMKNAATRPCTSFCPYHDECLRGWDMLSVIKVKCHEMVRVDNQCYHYADLEEAWQDFYNKFMKAVKSDKKIWHILKCQTAMGKTEVILELLKDTALRILIAVPTNKLKREVFERAKKLGIELIVSPSLHELEDELPDDVWSAIKILYDSGQSPMPYINKLISEGDIRCTKILKTYKKELEEFLNADVHAVTTHRRLTSLDISKYDLVIIDEDILYSTVITNKEEVSISELKKLRSKLTQNDPLAKKISGILDKKKEEYFEEKEIKYDKKYEDLKIYMNIPALCEANFFCYRKEVEEEEDEEQEKQEECITFIRPLRFRENVKYIMVSATVNEDVCKYYFGEDNIKFYECKEAGIKGGLIQYYNRPMSRAFITKNPDCLKEIVKNSIADFIITFKKLKRICKTEWYFGNCVGCDVMKDKNIDVVGTPHQPEWVYKLFAYSLGLDVDAVFKNMTVIHNGYRFRFCTFDNEQLRNIQFYMIETELEQAVGRARLLRCNCNVNLFSNFPLRQAVMRAYEYEEDKK